MSTRWSTYVGRGAIRFYLPLDVQLPNNFFTQAVHRGQGRAGARAAAERSSKSCSPTNSRASSARVYPLELGPPVGWPVQYRVSGPDHRARCATIALRARRKLIAEEPASQSTSTSTGSSRRGRCASASTRMRRACWA